jgi:hypothetical protein
MRTWSQGAILLQGLKTGSRLTSRRFYSCWEASGREEILDYFTAAKRSGLKNFMKASLTDYKLS